MKWNGPTGIVQIDKSVFGNGKNYIYYCELTVESEKNMIKPIVKNGRKPQEGAYRDETVF